MASVAIESTGDAGDVTQLLRRWRDGDATAVDRLMPLVYDRLRQLAGGYLRQERAGHTLQATALAHEAFLRLAGGDRPDWHSRAHFFALAARAMRRILVDHARRHHADRRGGGATPLPIELAEGLADDFAVADCERLLDLHHALDRLAEESPRQAQVVELRFFAGLTVDESATVVGVSTPTVVREWRFARAWLRRELLVGGSLAS